MDVKHRLSPAAVSQLIQMVMPDPAQAGRAGRNLRRLLEGTLSLSGGWPVPQPRPQPVAPGQACGDEQSRVALDRRGVRICTIRLPTHPAAVAVRRLVLESAGPHPGPNIEKRLGIALGLALAASPDEARARDMVAQLVTALDASTNPAFHLEMLVGLITQLGDRPLESDGRLLDATALAMCDALAEALLQHPAAHRFLSALPVALRSVGGCVEDPVQAHQGVSQLAIRLLERAGQREPRLPADILASLLGVAVHADAGCRRKTHLLPPPAWVSGDRQRLMDASRTLVQAALVHPRQPPGAAAALVLALTRALCDAVRDRRDASGWSKWRESHVSGWLKALSSLERPDLSVVALRHLLQAEWGRAPGPGLPPFVRFLASCVDTADLARALLGPDGILSGRQAVAWEPAGVAATARTGSPELVLRGPRDLQALDAMEVLVVRLLAAPVGSPLRAELMEQVVTPASRALGLAPQPTFVIVQGLLQTVLHWAPGQMGEMAAHLVAAQGKSVGSAPLAALLVTAAQWIARASPSNSGLAGMLRVWVPGGIVPGPPVQGPPAPDLRARHLRDLLEAIEASHRASAMACVLYAFPQDTAMAQAVFTGGLSSLGLMALAAYAGAPARTAGGGSGQASAAEVLAGAFGIALAELGDRTRPANKAIFNLQLEASLKFAQTGHATGRAPLEALAGGAEALDRGAALVRKCLPAAVALALDPQILVSEESPYGDNPREQFRLLALALLAPALHASHPVRHAVHAVEACTYLPGPWRGPMMVLATQLGMEQLEAGTFGKVHGALLARCHDVASAPTAPRVETKERPEPVLSLEDEARDPDGDALMADALGAWRNVHVPGPVGDLLAFYDMLEETSGLMYLYGRHPHDLTPERLKSHQPLIRRMLGLLAVARQQVAQRFGPASGEPGAHGEGVLLHHRLDRFGAVLKKGLETSSSTQPPPSEA